MHAIGLFDPSRGVRLGSYATHWIRSFCSELAGLERDVIYVPYDAAKRHKDLTNIRERLQFGLRRCATAVTASPANVNRSSLWGNVHVGA